MCQFLCPRTHCVSQNNHQQELAEYGPYDGIFVSTVISTRCPSPSETSVTLSARAMSMTLAMLKGANTAIKLHNSNLDNTLATDVHHFVIEFLTSADETTLYDELGSRAIL